MLSALVASVALTGAWFVTASFVFVLPTQQPLRHADAIVTLAPASTRIATAQRAFRQGVADEFWVSYFPQDRIDATGRNAVDTACAPGGTATTCFTPQLDSTFGEARRVNDLVTGTGSTSVIITTHVSHSARARFLFEQCLPEGTDVQLLLVEESDGWRQTLGRMVYETGAFVKALVDAASCR